MVVTCMSHAACVWIASCACCSWVLSEKQFFEEVFVVSPVLAYIIFMVIFPQLRRHLLDSNSSIFLRMWAHLKPEDTCYSIWYLITTTRGIHFCQPFDSATPKSSEKTWKISHNRPKERGVWRGGWRWSRGRGVSVKIIWFTESVLLHKMYLSIFVIFRPFANLNCQSKGGHVA